MVEIKQSKFVGELSPSVYILHPVLTIEDAAGRSAQAMLWSQELGSDSALVWKPLGINKLLRSCGVGQERRSNYPLASTSQWASGPKSEVYSKLTTTSTNHILSYLHLICNKSQAKSIKAKWFCFMRLFRTILLTSAEFGELLHSVRTAVAALRNWHIQEGRAYPGTGLSLGGSISWLSCCRIPSRIRNKSKDLLVMSFGLC